jgi:hypothetical protein
MTEALESRDCSGPWAAGRPQSPPGRRPGTAGTSERISKHALSPGTAERGTTTAYRSRSTAEGCSSRGDN